MPVRKTISECRPRTAGWRAVARRLLSAEGTQLLEFALVLPILLVLAVGGSDFGRAYNLKQKLTNAAREGARIAVQQTQADLTQNTPATVQGVRNAVVAYLQSENLETSFIGASPTKTGPMEWTYYSSASGSAILVIDRGAVVSVTVGSTTMLAVSTKITLRYPFRWSFGAALQPFSECPQGSPNCSTEVLVGTEVTMRNLT